MAGTYLYFQNVTGQNHSILDYQKRSLGSDVQLFFFSRFSIRTRHLCPFEFCNDGLA